MRKVLVIGGTRFFGKKLVKTLINSGNEVTILTRGIVKDDFGDKVKRIKCNRKNKEELKEALKNKKFDIVYDNICYSPKEALISTEVFNGKTKRYIVTSSAAVYNKKRGEMIKECEFNPKDYEITFGDREDFSYAEGKRLMEAVFYKYSKFEVAMVRFPVVIGENDYTGRLNSYINSVIKEKKIYSTKKDYKMNIITEDEAGIFLEWLGKKDINCPINAEFLGEVSLSDIIEMIEEETNVKAFVDSSIDIDDTSPYNDQLNLTMSTSYIRGFFLYRFKDAKSEIRQIIKEELRKEAEKWKVHLQKQ